MAIAISAMIGAVFGSVDAAASLAAVRRPFRGYIRLK
jgi:hypothetical protein